MKYFVVDLYLQNSPDNSPNDLWCDGSCRKEHVSELSKEIMVN